MIAEKRKLFFSFLDQSCLAGPRSLPFIDISMLLTWSTVILVCVSTGLLQHITCQDSVTAAPSALSCFASGFFVQLLPVILTL